MTTAAGVNMSILIVICVGPHPIIMGDRPFRWNMLVLSLRLVWKFIGTPIRVSLRHEI